MATKRYKTVPGGHPAQMLIAYGLVTLILGGVVLTLGVFAPLVDNATAFIIIGAIVTLIGGFAMVAGRAVVAVLTPIEPVKGAPEPAE